MMKFVPKVVTRSVGRKILLAKKNSPHIFFASGLAGVVGSTVLACRATLKLEETVDDIRNDVKNVKEMGVTRTAKGTYSEKEYHKDLGFVMMKSSVRIGKLYGPSVALGAMSITALTGSHIQLSRRNTALTATIGVMAKAYDDYRARVQAEVGEERELDLHRGIAHETRVVEGKGVVIKTVDPDGLSMYARIFDETCPEWRKDVEYNRVFLHAQQNYMNHLLKTRGHVFLNEVYDALGFEHTSAGAVVGWVLGHDGDDYIDFGIFEAQNSRFINGIERSIILDFNVDGVVYDKI
jgi:hypothetical protein